MRVAVMDYHISASYAAGITYNKDSLKRVVRCTVGIASTHIDVFFSLAELKDIVAKKRYDKLQGIVELKQLVMIVLKLLARRTKLTITLIDINIVSKATCLAKLTIRCADAALCAIYVADDTTSLTEVEECLTQLHRLYMRQYSKIFNAKMQFPLVLAKAIIAKEALANLQQGNVIMFDTLNLPPQDLRCGLNNLHLDLALLSR